MFKPDPRLSQRVEDEAGWSACQHPAPLLNSLQTRTTGRKLRLFACASWRWLNSSIARHACQPHVEVSERFADCAASENELALAFAACDAASGAIVAQTAPDHPAWKSAVVAKYTCHSDPSQAAFGAVVNMPCYVCPTELVTGKSLGRAIRRCWDAAKWFADTLHRRESATERTQANLVREVFGNSFRPLAIDPQWLTSDVQLLARGIYSERAFDRLPILADALMDAGCDSEELLNHLRSSGPHVRGCWAVDSILGRG